MICAGSGRVDPLRAEVGGAYRELLDNVRGSLKRCALEREHGVVAIEAGEGVAVAVEGFVVEVHELLCKIVRRAARIGV